MLTDKHCKNAACPPEKKRARFSDAHGLYLEVSATPNTVSSAWLRCWSKSVASCSRCSFCHAAS